MYYYYSNGLHISSELELPELPPSISKFAQIHIKKGSVPDNLEDALIVRPLRQISLNDFLFKIRNTAKYLVKGQSEILVEPEPDVPENVVRIFLLSNVFGVMLHKHEIFCLHASSIQTGNGSVLFAGQSGAGKSTLALGMLNRGYRVLNDDISSVFFNHDGHPAVYPGFKHLKLWDESMKQYGYDTAEYNALRKEVKKYSFPITQQSDTDNPVKAIIFLHASKETSIKHEFVEGLEKFQLLKKNVYRNKLIDELQKSTSHFQQCARFMNAVPFIKVTRPETIMPTDFTAYIEDLIGKL